MSDRFVGSPSVSDSVAESGSPAHAPDPKGDQRSFGSAVKWAYVMDGGRQILLTGSTFLLARILGPESFGVLALAMGYVMFVQMLQNQGLGAAVIQRSDLDAEHLDAAFWSLLGLSVALTAASVALAGWWADINDLPVLRPVVMVLSLLIPVQALVVVQEAVLRRHLDFRSLAIRTNVAALVAAAAAVGLALVDFDVWALVAQQVVTAIVGLGLLWRLSTWRPRIAFSLDALRSLARFSSLNFVATIAVFLTDRADSVLIGLFLGPVPAGIYYFATRLTNLVVDFTARSLQGASLPELARLQDEPEVLAARFSSILSLSALLSLPTLGLLAGLGGEIVALLGRGEWSPAGPALAILALAGGVRALAMFTGPTLQALGRPGLHAAMSWFAGLVSLLVLSVVGLLVRDSNVTAQVVNVAWGRVAAQGLILIAFMAPIVSIVGVPIRHLAKAVLPGMLGGIVGFAATRSASAALVQLPLFPRLVLAGAVGSICAGGILWFFEPRVRAWGTSALAARKKLRA